MKKISLLFSITTLALSATAQNKTEVNVPAVVKTAFETMHPSVKQVKWEKEEGMYEAEFKKDKTENAVLFTSTGTYVKTEVEISPISLPAPIIEYIKKNLADTKIIEASKITTANSTISYEVEIADIDYVFDAYGDFMGKIVEEKEDDK